MKKIICSVMLYGTLFGFIFLMSFLQAKQDMRDKEYMITQIKTEIDWQLSLDGQYVESMFYNDTARELEDIVINLNMLDEQGNVIRQYSEYIEEVEPDSFGRIRIFVGDYDDYTTRIEVTDVRLRIDRD